MENKYNLHCTECKSYYDMNTYVAKFNKKKNKCSGCYEMYIYTRDKEYKMRGLKLCNVCHIVLKTESFYDKKLNKYLNSCIDCSQLIINFD